MTNALKKQVREATLTARRGGATLVRNKQGAPIGYATASGSFIADMALDDVWQLLRRTIGNERTVEKRRSLIATINSMKEHCF